MLETQKYLESHSLDELQQEFQLKVFHHNTLPLVGLTYQQGLSPQYHPIVKECRGLVLEKQIWTVVAKPFNRFFNLGADPDQIKFNWDKLTTFTKEDGSLIILYYYADKWRVNTRGSFGEDYVNQFNIRWKDLFWRTSGIDRNCLNEDYTYLFELCTKYNKNVRKYARDKVFLLGCINKMYPHGELNKGELLSEATYLRVEMPRLHMGDLSYVKNLLIEKERGDPSFEGFVLCDDQFNRIKVKSKTYLELHRLYCNKQFNPRYIIPAILKDGIDPLLEHFPEWQAELLSMEKELKELYYQLYRVWMDSRHIIEQKDFATYVIKNTPFYSILFNLRQGFGQFSLEEDLKHLWKHSGDIIIKFWRKKYGNGTEIV